MESKYFAYFYSKKTKGNNMKRSVILELCRQNVIDEITKGKYSSKKKEGFGFLESLEVVGFKEYEEEGYYNIIFKFSFPKSNSIYIETIYKTKTGKITNTLYVSGGDLKEWRFK